MMSVNLLQAFTGDTLLLGSCGRPDLVGSIGYTAEDMAKMMFRSMTSKVATLPDHVQVCVCLCACARLLCV